MAIKIGSNFTFQGEQPNFERDRFATKAAMKAFPETSIDDGHLSYCVEDGNTYQFKSSNSVDTTTGKWRVFKADVDLSKYATKDSVNTELDKKADKAKAFTTDTVSTAPCQFVAGPATTKGNLSLRKLDISDIPDLRSKYQVLDQNGYQLNPKITNATIGTTGGKFLTASIPAYDTGQNSPDWYYATDGTLQDITTKIPKITLDDAVSTTSTNGVENQAITKYVDGKVTTINTSITDIRTSLESTQTDFVDLRNKVNAMPKTVFITQAAYDALTTKDANTIYYING